MSEYQEAVIFVPKPHALLAEVVTPGSGIVGVVKPHGGAVVYYEGNVHRAENLSRYEDRIKCAAGRLFQQYPTIATSFVSDPEEDLIAVGRISARYEIRFDSPEAEAVALAYGSEQRMVQVRRGVK